MYNDILFFNSLTTIHYSSVHYCLNGFANKCCDTFSISLLIFYSLNFSGKKKNNNFK